MITFTIGFGSVFIIRAGLDYTSTDTFCESCHVHPQATKSWRFSTHYDTESGVVVHCVDCHLPPAGFEYLTEKAKSGARDVYGKLFKDISKINWEEKSKRENAVKFTFKTSCLHCHQNLFPRSLSKKGEDAHLHYEQRAEQLRCLNCHLEVGHYREKPVELTTIGVKDIQGHSVIYTKAAEVDSFKDFTETIPGTTISFEMIAIPGGTFSIGSPKLQSYREPDEGPQRMIKVNSFWIGKTEVSWDEYDAFYRQTAAEGRTEDQYAANQTMSKFDAVTGPTPPYGNPDQGWGKSGRPAITMTHYAATKYCEWLSKVTGKKYRLPTEAEWEYAARGKTEGPYFFTGNPEQYSKKNFWNRLFGADTSVINSYVIYDRNSQGKTHPQVAVRPNFYGLLHTLGNVKEFCLDWYAPDTYATYPETDVVVDPTGPKSGTEYVIRGGSYKSDAAAVRIADRNYTRHDAWMLTDPQMPKSLWWYSDNSDVGFRVVCEYEVID